MNYTVHIYCATIIITDILIIATTFLILFSNLTLLTATAKALA